MIPPSRRSGRKRRKVRTLPQQRLFNSVPARIARQILIAALALACIPARSDAQNKPIPEAIIRSSSSLQSSQIDEIKRFVGDAMSNDNWGSDHRIRQARNAVMEPLADAQVSAPFRLEYSKQLEPHLERLAGGAAPRNELAVVNALLIAGDIATDASVAIAEKRLSDESVAVRYAAVKAMTLTLESLARHTPAIMPERAARIVRTLGKQLATDPDSRVADAAVRGLIAGMNVTRQGFGEVRTQSVSELAVRLGARLKSQDGKPIDDMLVESSVQAATAVRDALANPGAAGTLPAAVQKEAAGLAGDMVAYVARIVRKGEDLPQVAPTDTPDEAAVKTQARVGSRQMVAVSETVITLAGGAKTSPLNDLLKSASPQDDARFLDSTTLVIGPAGSLQKPPFGFADDRFQSK